MRINTAAKPEGGWRRVIVDQVYGGRMPSALDTTFPTLVQQLARRSQEPTDWFQIALNAAPFGAPPPA
jgi:hypothetical protein